MAMDTTQGEQAGLLQFIAAEKENLRREREALALERLRLQRGEQPGLNGQHHPDERREVQVGAGNEPRVERQRPMTAPRGRPPSREVERPASSSKRTAAVKPSLRGASTPSDHEGGMQFGEYDKKRQQYRDQRHQDYLKHMSKQQGKRPSSARRSRPSTPAQDGKRPASRQLNAVGLPLGDYESKVKLLQAERYREYREFLKRQNELRKQKKGQQRKKMEERKAEYATHLRKQENRHKGQTDHQSDEGLPLRERLSAKQRLKEERHKEYIQYLEQLKTDRETAGADTKDSRGAHGAMPSGHEEHRENMRRQRAADYQDHLRSQGSQHELAELARGTTHGAPGALPPRTNPLTREELQFMHRGRQGPLQALGPFPPPPESRYKGGWGEAEYYEDALRHHHLLNQGGYMGHNPSYLPVPPIVPMDRPLPDNWASTGYPRGVSPLGRKHVRFDDPGGPQSLQRHEMGSMSSTSLLKEKSLMSHPGDPYFSSSATNLSHPPALGGRTSRSATERSLLQRQMSPMYQVNPLLSYGASHDMAGPGLNSHRVNGSQPQSHTEQRGRRSVVSPDDFPSTRGRYTSPLPPGIAGPGEGGGISKDKKEAYRAELQRQMKEKAKRDEEARRKRDEDEQNQGKDNPVYDPWGKSGAGAPNRDRTGRVVADLRQMRTKNETGEDDTEDMSQTVVEPLPSGRGGKTPGLLDGLLTSPGRGGYSLLSDPPPAGEGKSSQSPEKITGGAPKVKTKAVVEYRDYLRQQMEEKAALKRKQEEKKKEEEEEEARRLEEDRIRLKEDYERELERQRLKDEAAKKENKAMSEEKEANRKAMASPFQGQSPPKATVLQLPTTTVSPPSTWQAAPRALSPPVPAVRKMLSGSYGDNEPEYPVVQRAASPVRPIKSKYTAAMAAGDDIPPEPSYRQHEPGRSYSPPVPGLTNPSQRSSSPPVPALRGTQPKKRPDSVPSSRPPTRPYTRPSSRPSSRQSRRGDKQATIAEDDTRITSVTQQLASLRQRLDIEQQQLQNRMRLSEKQYSALREVNNANRSQILYGGSKSRQERTFAASPGDIFESVVTKKKPQLHIVGLKDTSSIKTSHPPLSKPKSKGRADLQHEMSAFNSFKYRGSSPTRQLLVEKFPDPPMSAESVDRQQKSLLRHQLEDIQQLQRDLAAGPAPKATLSRRFPVAEAKPSKDTYYQERSYGNIVDSVPALPSTTQHKYVDSQLEPEDTRFEYDGVSLALEAETEYIPVDDDPEEIPILREAKRRGSSRKASRKPAKYKESYDNQSLTSFATIDPDILVQQNEERLRRLRLAEDDFQKDSYNPADILQNFVARQQPLERSSSPAASLRTETILRPVSSDTLF